MTLGWFLIFLFVGIVLVLPFLAEARRAGPPRSREALAGGALARLPGGQTYFEWHGPVDGEVLVCVHGLSTPGYIWQGVLRPLTTMGYRVLVYDLYGRGLSDGVDGPQDRAFFLRQLREVLADQGIGSCSLIGFSMGGQIAMALAAEEPDRIERLILLAPAGFGYDPGRLGAILGDSGWLGNWLNLVFGRRQMRRALAPLAATRTAVPNLAERQARQIARRNFPRVVLSSQRHMLAGSAQADMARIGKMQVPVLAVWGEKDSVIPANAIGLLARANRAAHQVTVPGASHWLPATHPREIAAAITNFRREI